MEACSGHSSRSLPEWVSFQRVVGRQEVIFVLPNCETGAPQAVFFMTLIKAIYLEVIQTNSGGRAQEVGAGYGGSWVSP